MTGKENAGAFTMEKEHGPPLRNGYSEHQTDKGKIRPTSSTNPTRGWIT